MSGSGQANRAQKRDAVESWAERARTLLVETARQAGLEAPGWVLDKPEMLVEVFDEMLRPAKPEELSDQEIITLTTQLAALAAQVLHVEHGAVWQREDDPSSASHGAFVLARPAEADSERCRFDPFRYAMSEVTSGAPDVRRFLDQARALITSTHNGVCSGR